MVNEPSVFEPLKFYCIFVVRILRTFKVYHAVIVMFDPLYTDTLFQYFMLDEFICHFRGGGSVLSLLFMMKVMLANPVDPDQTPHLRVSR